MKSRINDALELAHANDDFIAELSDEYEAISFVLDEMSLQAIMTGEHDWRNAFLTIRAIPQNAKDLAVQEAHDWWTEAISRWYLKWLEQSDFEIRGISGENTYSRLPNSWLIEGHNSYGILRNETGIHSAIYSIEGQKFNSSVYIAVTPFLRYVELNPDETEFRNHAHREYLKIQKFSVEAYHFPSEIRVLVNGNKNLGETAKLASRLLHGHIYLYERDELNLEKVIRLINYKTKQITDYPSGLTEDFSHNWLDNFIANSLKLRLTSK